MAQASATPQSSRLVRYLQDLAVADAELSHKNFTDKLGRLIDLTDSIYLADALRGLPRLAFTPATTPVASCREEFLQARQAMVEFIAGCFNPASSAPPFSLPKPDPDTLLDDSGGFAPYQKFYALLQSEMDFRIIKLRRRVRQAVAAYSQPLAQLAALDTALGDTLAAHGRKSLAAIPRLLGQRFLYLRQRHLDAQMELGLELEDTPGAGAPDQTSRWTQRDGWLGQFFREMQGLLLAELELRLQPVLGLVEALDSEIERTQ